jgi:hypothetical protein
MRIMSGEHAGQFIGIRIVGLPRRDSLHADPPRHRFILGGRQKEAEQEAARLAGYTGDTEWYSGI